MNLLRIALAALAPSWHISLLADSYLASCHHPGMGSLNTLRCIGLRKE
jgi:hypothetical protein